MAVIIPIVGLFLAAGVALYTISGERRDVWLRARERSLHFCAELADVCDGILASQSGPSADSLPPVPTSLLLYLDKGLPQDLRQQIAAPYMSERFIVQPYGLEVAHQISDTCVNLHIIWERVTGVMLQETDLLGVAERVEQERFSEYYLYKALHMRQRITILYQKIASQQLATRRRVILYLALRHMPARSSYWLRRRLKPPADDGMSVNMMLG
jgi:hypothetical protein